jgi:hypothetical protein
MSHYTRNYKQLANQEADKAALEDIREYLENSNALASLIRTAQSIRDGECDIETLGIWFGFAGISGYPFHAFCRQHCLEAYKRWMKEGGIETDREGFQL